MAFGGTTTETALVSAAHPVPDSGHGNNPESSVGYRGLNRSKQLSKYPPAEPGAFKCEPLEAAYAWSLTRPRLVGATFTVAVISRGSSGRSADLPSPGYGCTPVSSPHPGLR